MSIKWRGYDTRCQYPSVFNYLMRLSPSIRDTIDFGSPRFKTIYNQRTSVERGFSRLLSIALQNPTVVGLAATRNHCTISHITMLFVALAAHCEGFPDKIRYVKILLASIPCLSYFCEALQRMGRGSWPGCSINQCSARTTPPRFDHGIKIAAPRIKPSAMWLVMVVLLLFIYVLTGLGYSGRQQVIQVRVILQPD